MRWVARYGKKRRNDGATFTSAECRERFVEAALIAGDLWAKRVYGGKLTAGPSVDEVRLKALGLAQRRRGRKPRGRISASRSGAGSNCSLSICRVRRSGSRGGRPFGQPVSELRYGLVHVYPAASQGWAALHHPHGGSDDGL
jgi:hypothetical protein